MHGGLVVVVAGSGDDATGASSPTEAVQRLAAAIDSDDLIGALDVVAPDEIDGLKPLIDAVKARAKDPKLKDAFQPANLAGGLPGFLFGGGSLAESGGLVRTDVVTPTSTPDNGLGVSVALDDVVETKLAEHAAAVDAKVTASVQLPSFDLGGAIDEVTGSEGAPSEPNPTAHFSLRLITVQLASGWYVSPMLTGAELLAKRADAPGPDWSKVDAPPPTTKAASAVEAVEAAARAIATQDVDAMIDVMGPGEARVVRVFHDATKQLLSDVDVQVTVNDVKATAVDGGAVLSLLDLTAVDPDGVEHHGVWKDACFAVDDEPADCMIDDNGMQRIGLTPDDLVLKVVTADGNHRVSALGSIFGLVQHVVSTIGDQQLLNALGLQYLDDATTIDATAETSGSTTAEQPYAVYEFDGEAQTSYYAEVDTPDDNSFCYGTSWRQSEGGSWMPEYFGFDELPAGKVRLVVQCDEPTDFTFTLSPSIVEPGNFPGGDDPFVPTTDGDSGMTTETRTVDLTEGEQVVQIEAPADAYIDVVVYPTDADVALSTPECPECGVADEVSARDPADGAEYLSWIATGDGTHQLVIASTGATAGATADVVITVYPG